MFDMCSVFTNEPRVEIWQRVNCHVVHSYAVGMRHSDVMLGDMMHGDVMHIHAIKLRRAVHQNRTAQSNT